MESAIKQQLHINNLSTNPQFGPLGSRAGELEKCQSPPTMCPKLTEKEVASLWNQPHLRDFLQIIGYEQAGLYVFHNPRDLNKSLLLGSLNLFLALRPQPLQSIALSKPDPQQNSSNSMRDQEPPQTSVQGEEQSKQDLQEISRPGIEESRQDPQETSALREVQSWHDPREALAQADEQSRQDPQETSTNTMRDRKTRQGIPESLVDTGRDKKTRQDLQKSLVDSAKDKKSRQGPQESSVDTVRGKKNRHGPQKTTAARNKKNRQGPLETAAARNKRTKHCLQEVSVLSDKQTEPDTQETTAGCETTACPSGKSKVRLNTLKPLLVLRRQIMMQTPWLTVKPTPEEVRVKHDLAKKLNSLRSQQQTYMHRIDLWHKKALSELERKPENRGDKRQDFSPKKLKVKVPRTPSTAKIPFDMPTPASQKVALRSSAQEIRKEQEENVRHRHRAAVKDLFLPFIDPLP
ncbi:uncharacterized protein LOC121281494 [Carcharodon carcharias]|uniref:uncharacterized protein LOC121281494 n=1 Tax=Carcharodon carcharias TaxID=13397 RepID=UPI001B7F373D|nr:uncharacterized protein LOC121281494 [Carcharodon carcharias]